MKKMTTKEKQEIIENKIDSYEGFYGDDMIALIALHARIVISKWKADKFIKQFSESLGFIHHIDTAILVIRYLYPDNQDHRAMWDKIYSDRVKKSGWLQANLTK